MKKNSVCFFRKEANNVVALDKEIKANLAAAQQHRTTARGNLAQVEVYNQTITRVITNVNAKTSTTAQKGATLTTKMALLSTNIGNIQSCFATKKTSAIGARNKADASLRIAQAAEKVRTKLIINSRKFYLDHPRNLGHYNYFSK